MGTTTRRSSLLCCLCARAGHVLRGSRSTNEEGSDEEFETPAQWRDGLVNDAVVELCPVSLETQGIPAQRQAGGSPEPQLTQEQPSTLPTAVGKTMASARSKPLGSIPEAREKLLEAKQAAEGDSTSEGSSDASIEEVDAEPLSTFPSSIHVPAAPESESSGTPVLHLAAQYPSPGPVRSLLKAGANVHEKDENGVTALHIAALCGSLDVVDELLKGGASPATLAIDGSTPLHVASRSGSAQVLHRLLDARADADAKDSAGGTALHCAAGADHRTLVQALLRKRANCQVVDNWGRSPLHAAAYSGSAKVASVLLECGADPHVKDVLGETPLHMATTFGHMAVVSLLSATVGQDPPDKQQSSLRGAAMEHVLNRPNVIGM